MAFREQEIKADYFREQGNMVPRLEGFGGEGSMLINFLGTRKHGEYFKGTREQNTSGEQGTWKF